MKRDSWHYKMAKFSNNNMTIHNGEMSICEYCRHVFWGSFAAVAITAILVAIAFVVLAGVYQLVGWTFGFVELGPFGQWLALMFVFIGVVVGYIAGKNFWRHKSEALMSEENNSFVAKAYKSYKQKFCFDVEFE